MSPRPFLLRLLLPFSVMIVLIVGICGGMIWWGGQRAIHLQQIQDLDRLARLVRPWVETEEQTISSRQREQLDHAGKVLNARITLIDGQGQVLFDNEASPEVMENHSLRPEVVEARTGGVGKSVRFSHTLGESAVYVAELVNSERRGGLVLRLSFPERMWAHLAVPVWVVLITGIGAAILVIGLMGGMLQRQWIGPVRELARAAERMAGGDWTARVVEQGADEIRIFSGKMNLVAAHAQQQVDDLRNRQADLQALMDALPSPIVVSDGERRIALINFPAAQMFQISPAQAMGKKLASVVTDEAVLELFDAVDAGGNLQGGDSSAESFLQRHIRVIRDGQRFTYQAFAAHRTGGGVLLVLRDISELSSAMQMKTDFVANASHELRTPIAAIKIAFETLSEVIHEDPQQSERCMRIIEGHLRQLEEMLSDLLDLSRVENPDLKPQLSPVRTAELFAGIWSALEGMARQKNIEMVFTSDPDAEQFYSDPRLLNLVMKNLVENSIKFTPTGGKVTVEMRRSEEGGANGIVLTVADTGVGIPPEHIDRVFERFYQVDPARTGMAGRGTGLGLAIVKHAVAAMGGTVQLKSAVGVGTSVTCLLPQGR